VAFVHSYTKLHRCAPADADLLQFLRVTPPSVRGMIVKLPKIELIVRQCRSPQIHTLAHGPVADPPPVSAGISEKNVSAWRRQPSSL
jgi:hypothetical protein